MKSMFFRVMLVLIAFVIVPESWAADTAGGSVFLDAKLGYVFGRQADSAYSNSGTHTSWGADGGYLWKFHETNAAGFEAGYMHFGQVDDQFHNEGGSNTSANAISLGGRLEVLLGEDRATIFQARAGLLSVRLHQYFYSNFVDSSGTDSWHESGIYLGLGIGRKLTQSFSVLLAFNQFTVNGNSTAGRNLDLDLPWIGLEAEYQF